MNPGAKILGIEQGPWAQYCRRLWYSSGFHWQ